MARGCRKLERGENLPENYTPQTTFLMGDDNKLIETVNIRHYTNSKTEIFGGHIRYLIRPSKRKKGYENIILMLALEAAEDLL